ncbi:Rv1733c family protein [Rhodococcus chondri]|uniref:Transmembrane protein n=1 Tax=Rhodococcus chondri TaxID=3065941 RepID=A0ABU7JL06_9NOCA|nr:hypothetical protein [Rhodococcus sp. CC-R104]MEE2030724.1 hypothetical protein [Rhodococcus sp. CC-R104]
MGYLRGMRRGVRSRNPLVRRTDRLESRIVGALVAALLIMLPVAVWIGSATWGNQVALAERQLAERTSVTATVDTGPEAADVGWGEFAYATPAVAAVSWEWGEQPRHGLAQVGSGTAAGTEVLVWVDRDGEQTTMPLTVSAAKFSSVLVGVSLWILAALLAAGVFAFAHWRIDHRRTRDWSRDIEAFLGSTSSH